MTELPDKEVEALADELRAHKEGHRDQLDGPLFQKGLSTAEAFAGVTVETVERVAPPMGSQAATPPREATPQAMGTHEREALPPKIQAHSNELPGPLVDVLVQMQNDLRELTRRFSGTPAKAPAWLKAAAPNLLAIDLPNSSRTQAGVRVVPALQRKIIQVQQRRGMRSLVGAWELVLRLGLAAEEHLPLEQS